MTIRVDWDTTPGRELLRGKKKIGGKSTTRKPASKKGTKRGRKR